MSNYSYNLSDFGGYWSALNDEGSNVETNFGAGEFPLQITHKRNVSGDTFSMSTATFIVLKTSDFFSKAKAGDHISVTFRIPDVSNSWGSSAYDSYDVQMKNEDGTKRVECSYQPESDEIILETEHEGAFAALSWDTILSDAIMNPIIEDEKTVGFTLTGKLLDTISDIYMYPAFFSDSPMSNHTVSVTYASYDDLQITLIPVTPSTPFCLRSWLTGFALGLAGKSLPYSKVIREPVAYLYNGVRLPKLPEWDKEKYPYAAIDDYTSTSGKRYVTLYVFTEQYTISAGSDKYAYSNFMKPLCSFSYDSENEKWGELDNWDDSHPDNSGVQGTVGDVIWTNFDWTVGWVNPYQTITKYKVGDVVLSASDPVPVYE